MPSSRIGPFVLVAIVVIGCLGAGVWLGVSGRDAPPLIISVVLACAVSALLYGILGGVGEAGFSLGPVKMGGSAAVLVGSAYVFNWLLEPQMDAIRAARTEAILDDARFDFGRHVEPARDWFAINRETGAPMSVQFIDPVTGKEAFVIRPPTRANLRFRLEEREGRGDYLVSGVDADAGLGSIAQESLEGALGLMGDLELGTTYGPRRLHLTNAGELSPDTPRTWGGRRCLGTRLPMLIQVNRFEDDYTDYEVFPCDSDERLESSLRLGEGELHRLTIDGRPRNFVVAVVAADHRAPPFWSSFVVIEMVQSGS